MRLLERHELSVGEIAAVLQLPQSTTSRHLKALSDDGWLSSRREGTSRRYRLALDRIHPKQTQLWNLLRDGVSDAHGDDARLARVLEARQARSQAFFAGAAHDWDVRRAHLFGERLDQRLLPALLDPELVIADLGCGAGRLSEVLSPFVAQVVGVDASEAMIAAARVRLSAASNVTLHQARLEELPLGSASVDLALLILVLHTTISPLAVLQEASRVLVPRGRLVIVDLQPHDREEYRQQMGHQWLGFDEPQLQTWLHQAGLGAIRYHSLSPDPSAEGPPLFTMSATLAPSPR